MNKIFITLFILLSYVIPLSISSHEHNPSQHYDDEALAFEVHQRDYNFSTVFELFSYADYFGTIVKSCFHVRTHYDLYNIHGHYEGQGICRYPFFNPTSILGPWAKEIDLYDHEGAYLGCIEGDLITSTGAKYSIYNLEGNRVGIAYLDLSNAGFTMVHPDNEMHIISHFRRDFEEGEIDHWHVKVFDQDMIDLRILKVFGAFAVDHQEYFKEDN